MSAGFLQKFYSAFPGGTVQQRPGGGSISEAGGVLTLTCPAADCRWDANAAPLAWLSVPSLMASYETVFKFESRLYSITYSGSVVQGAVVLYQTDYADSLMFGWYANDAKIYLTRWGDGSGANVTNTGAVANPTTSPHTYRIYWNPASRKMFVQDEEVGTSIDPNGLQFWYRVGDAGTWALLHSRIWEWDPNKMRFGMLSRNFASTYYSNTSLFSHCGIYQWDDDSVRVVPGNDPVSFEARVDPQDTVGMEDIGRLPGEGGDPRFDTDNSRSSWGHKEGLRAGMDDAARTLTSGLAGDLDRYFGRLDDQGSGVALLTRYASLADEITSYSLSLEPQFSTLTQDLDLHPHFLYLKPYLSFYYDCSNEDWANPTTTNFTGYARDGYKYTNGVQDAGPISAPWRTEASSNDRSSRADFPLRSLLVVTQRELVIFDLDSFSGPVGTLRVWMRFKLGNDSSNYYALGRGVESIRAIEMANGLLAVGTKETGWENGGLHSIDFKATTTATTFNLIRSDGQWIGSGIKTIVDRNTTNCYASSGSYRIEPEQVNSLSVRVEGGTVYIAIAGEDPSPVVLRYVNNTIQDVWPALGEDIGDYNVGDYRQVLFDDVGWLWYSIGRRLYRNCTDWREGYICPTVTDRRQGSVLLPAVITHLSAAKNDVYAGTENGVYRIPKGTLAAYLAYTGQGGGGGGRLNNPPDGEKLVGAQSIISSMRTYTLQSGDFVFAYLSVGTQYDETKWGGFTLIRLYDDFVTLSYQVPDIMEPGTYISSATIVP